MSQISQKSITGITSITTPVGIDDLFTIHSGNTTECFRVDQSGNQNITGIVTATNFKTGSSNLHSTGLNVGNTFVHSTGINGSSADIDDFIDVGSNIKLGNAGVITATSFVGDGSDLTNLPAGLGTALSATASSPLNKMYYTNQVLGVPSSITVDVPTSASKAYTQYADIKVESSADLIVAEGDDLIPDVLGLADFGTFGGGASAGRIRVNSISNAANDGSPTVQKGLVVTGVCTATSFSGSGANLTSLPAQATIANNADNRIITGGSGVNLNGEANLTFDGNILTATQGNSAIGAIIKNTAHDSELQILATYANKNSKLLFGDAADDDVGIIDYDHNTNNMIFTVNANERLRIDTVGSIGQGTGTPRTPDGSNADNPLNGDGTNGNPVFTIYGDSPAINLVSSTTASGDYSLINFGRTGSSSNPYRAVIGYKQSNDILRINAQNEIAFDTGGNINTGERLRIDSSGRLLIGTTATDNRDGYNSSLQVAGTGGDDSSMCIGRYSDNVSYPALIFSKSRNGTINNHTRVNTGDYLGGIQFQGDDGTRFLVGASIVAQAASPVADYDMATDLVISTNYGTTSPSKSMTFDHQGRLTKPNTPFVMVTINSRTDWATTGSFMTIPWDTIHGRSTSSNVGSHFNTSNHRFTAPVDGRYLFVLSLNIVGDNIVKHRINGADVTGGEYRITQLVWDHLDASFIYDMNANDYYDTVSQLYDGSGKRWNGGNNNTFGWDTLSIYHLG